MQEYSSAKLPKNLWSRESVSNIRSSHYYDYYKLHLHVGFRNRHSEILWSKLKSQENSSAVTWHWDRRWKLCLARMEGRRGNDTPVWCKMNGSPWNRPSQTQFCNLMFVLKLDIEPKYSRSLDNWGSASGSSLNPHEIASDQPLLEAKSISWFFTLHPLGSNLTIIGKEMREDRQITDLTMKNAPESRAASLPPSRPSRLYQCT